MFRTGDKIIYNGIKAIVLIENKDEVLILEGDYFVKWVGMDQIEKITAA